MKLIKKYLLFLIMFVVCVLMQACVSMGPTVVYTKNDIDLYSVAIHSVAGVFSSGLDEVLVLDEDAYGRKLFFINLTRSSLIGDIAGVFIAQKKEEKYVYYYENINYILKSGAINKPSKEKVYEKFSLKELETLKEQNDWGNEDISRGCFKVPIKGDKFYLSDKIPEEKLKPVGDKIFGKVLGDTPMSEDSFGNIIWFMKGKTCEADLQERYYLFLFNEEGELKSDEALMEINDIWDYRDQMIAFKEANGWNIP